MTVRESRELEKTLDELYATFDDVLADDLYDDESEPQDDVQEGSTEANASKAPLTDAELALLRHHGIVPL